MYVEEHAQALLDLVVDQGLRQGLGIAARARTAAMEGIPSGPALRL